ncbi:MAG: Ig-like domain-containing protein [Ghiorsea sp.]|nr:Ig-like domain-containing protein [Ghiorsea sp.]
MIRKLQNKKTLISLLVMVFLLVSCGTPPAGTTTAGTTTAGTTTAGTTAPITPSPTVPSSTAASLALSASPISVKSDGSDVSVVTATVLDAGFAVVSNATVVFSATGGQLSAASAVSDVNGKASIEFSAGASKANQISTITATVQGVIPTVTSQIPLQSVGSTVSVVSVNTNVTGTVSDTLAITVNDSGGTPIFNAPVSFTQSGAGSVTITPATVTTDINGTAQVTVAGVTSGAVNITVSAAGANVTQAYTVTIAGIAFSITSPLQDPYALTTNIGLPVTVTVPTGITSVTFATSLGVWNGLTSVQSVAVAGGVATATLLSTQAGLASVQVYDTANIGTSDTMTVALSQPVASATQIALQSNVNVVAPSLGGVSNTVTLTAAVRDVNGQAVGGAPVAFSVPSPTGGGENISPVVGISDALGQVTATFTSGSLSTGAQGVDVYATVLNTAIAPAISTIVIGGAAGSVAIGAASVVELLSSTTYALPMSVLVADGNGNAVPNSIVTLQTTPTFFATGHWVDSDPSPTVVKYFPCRTGIFPSEDLNQDAILDPGEDVPHVTLTSSCDIYGAAIGGAVTYPVNGKMDIGVSTGGTVPATVTTDANGVANFKLVYQKASAAWITDKITASVPVLGTETSSNISFVLPYAKSEGESGFLPNSNFGQ